MAVIPRCSKLRGLEKISLRSTGSNRALCYASYSVRANKIQLADTVPVNIGSVVLHGVLYSDTDIISPAGSDDGTRILAVNKKALSRSVTIWVACGVGNFKTIRDSVASGRVLLIKICGNAVTATPARSCQGPVRA